MYGLGERPLDLFEGVAEAFFVGLGDGRRTGVGAHAVFEEIDVLVVLVQFVFFEEVPHLGVGQGAHVLDAVLLYLSPEFVVHLFGDVCALLSLELLVHSPQVTERIRALTRGWTVSQAGSDLAGLHSPTDIRSVSDAPSA